MSVRIQSGLLDAGAELDGLLGSVTESGATACFVGTVRSTPDRPVLSMTIEHYPGMTEAAIADHVRQAGERWPLLGCRVIHRIGEMKPGDAIVMVAVMSAHRFDAFEAAEFLMDYLKSRAPFWKKEVTASGSSWVEARPQDEIVLKRWQR